MRMRPNIDLEQLPNRGSVGFFRTQILLQIFVSQPIVYGQYLKQTSTVYAAPKRHRL